MRSLGTKNSGWSIIDTSTYIISENEGATTGFMITANDTMEYGISTLTKTEHQSQINFYT